MFIGQCVSYLLSKYNIFIVDDDIVDIMALKKVLCNINYNFTCCETGNEAIDKFETGKYDCVILDYILPDINADELFKKIKEQEDIPIIILTGQGNETLAVDFIKMGAYDYMPKSNIKNINDSIVSAIDHSRKLLEQAKSIENRLDRLSELD